MNDTFKDIEKLEADLWEAADNLRANSKLTSSDYFMPVLGVIFLRHAANRFGAAHRQIEADQADGKMPPRKVVPADYVARRSLYLPEAARYDYIVEKAALSGADLPRLVTDAMTAIEAEFEPLLGVLPKDYGIFEPKVLEDLLRLFNSERVRHASGDVFGRIYEYFLAKFSMQKAHDNGEFFTPSSLVQTIVNVIEPDHGKILDPACGSGGMFVQSSHFIEGEGADTAQRVVFYGQEKNRDTIRIAKMNLAVHGLDGQIAEAITYYQDAYDLVGKCDFVMANPPFNVDLVDAERIRGDVRLPFGLPGVNKQKRVGNGNYLWISYFWSYLSDRGRAGFVMSSQASNAGHGEREVRRKIVETGDVDVMIAIRSNFFYTRTVPCELWHFDRGKPVERKDKVLMIDARNVYRKVTRKIFDFSPEQTNNLAAIVWLYRGQQQRFLALVNGYLSRVAAESLALGESTHPFGARLALVREHFGSLSQALTNGHGGGEQKVEALAQIVAELDEVSAQYLEQLESVIRGTSSWAEASATAHGAENDVQWARRDAFDPYAEALRDLVKRLDHIHRLSAAAGGLSGELVRDGLAPRGFDHRAERRLLKSLDEERRDAAGQLKNVVYFYRQVTWLQDRFPQAVLVDVPGLVKLVDLDQLEAGDWSLAPGRYVGVAPPEPDEDFDFERTLRDIHSELTDLDVQAVELAADIGRSFEALGA